MKTYAHLSRPSGTVVVIDSDMIVTGSLDHVLALASEGKICVSRRASYSRTLVPRVGEP
jgi:hypothetical protein